MVDDKFRYKDFCLTYDDVLLVPEKSSVRSRTEVDLSTTLSSEVHLKYPIMSAAMDTVTNGVMAGALASIGAMGIIHRFQSADARRGEAIIAGANRPIGIAVGLQDSIEDCIDLSEVAEILAVDVAHAHHDDVLEFVKKLHDSLSSNTLIMIGNIVTRESAFEFIDAGADILKVGIGGGSVCSTRTVTGFGVPNITAIMEVRKAVDDHPNGKFIHIVADGGIRGSNDIAKAIAAGAHLVMVGSLFAGTVESPGEYDPYRGVKEFRGMSSLDAQVDWKGGLKNGTVAEGISTLIPMKGLVEMELNKLVGGLRSSLTYAGAYNLQEFYENTQFVKVTSNAIKESRPHILDKER